MTQGIVARRYVVTGLVQGVGYRNFVEHLAGKINVQGYVRNRHDGCVEVLGMGTPEELQKLRRGLEKGPMMAPRRPPTSLGGGADGKVPSR